MGDSAANVHQLRGAGSRSVVTIGIPHESKNAKSEITASSNLRCKEKPTFASSSVSSHVSAHVQG